MGAVAYMMSVAACSHSQSCTILRDMLARVGGVVGYRICLTHRRSSVRTWADSSFFFWLLRRLLIYTSGLLRSADLEVDEGRLEQT